MKRFVASALLAASVFAVLGIVVVGVLAASTTPAEAAPCRCPLIYAPVICDNGRTYPNPCVAECRNAKNCVPTGEL